VIMASVALVPALERSEASAPASLGAEDSAATMGNYIEAESKGLTGSQVSTTMFLAAGWVLEGTNSLLLTDIYARAFVRPKMKRGVHNGQASETFQT
jgi:hypothetical protein